MKYSFSLLLYVFSSSAFAIFCPTNFNEIQVGDTLTTVINRCGKPTSQKSYVSRENLPQEWNYYVRMSPDDQATIKMTVAFVDNKATNMNVNGVGLTNTQICNEKTVQIGDSQESVEKACGKPAYVMEGNRPQDLAADAGTPMMDLVYSGSGTPTTLVFEAGKFKERK